MITFAVNKKKICELGGIENVFKLAMYYFIYKYNSLLFQ